VIDKRLFDWHKIDTTKNLGKSVFCPKPYDTLLIDSTGSCFACECQAWLPQSVGNIQIKPLEEIMKSPIRKLLQESIEDGSYRYCNSSQCSWLKSDTLHFTEKPKDTLKNIRLAIDNSCNLRCPSCRTHQIFLNRGPVLRVRFKMIEKILDYIRGTDQHTMVHIGSDGDPFVSLVYRHLMRSVPNNPNVRYTIQTNGLLLKKQYSKMPNVFDNMEALNISIDGATKQTYEKLRLGGSWKVINENLEFVSEVKKFPVHLHMVVQRDNWREMPAMMQLAERLDFDKVYFNMIQDWGTGMDFSQQQFTHLDEFKTIVEQLDYNYRAKMFTLS
jgi:MoaA/NifB/PqqE/SkfB family radical SAM enzyme